MNLVYGPDVVGWVSSRIRHSSYGPEAQGIGLEEGGQIVCGVVYSQYSGTDLQMSIAAETPRWCTRGNLRAFFHYPFVQLGCVRVTSLVAKANKRARRLNEGLGFTLEGVHPKGMPDGVQTALSYGMLREKCKWL